MSRWGVFLDRDGVINEEVGYLSSPASIRLLPGAAQAVRWLNCLNIPTIVITNQAGVARGLFSEARVHEIHQALSDLLAAEGAHIDRYYYCPHHPTEGIEAYRLNCECRKPKLGLVRKAEKELQLDLSCSYFVGDNVLDIETGNRAGIRSILVLTGYGKTFWQNWPVPVLPDHVAQDLRDAVEWIVKTEELVLSSTN